MDRWYSHKYDYICIVALTFVCAFLTASVRSQSSKYIDYKWWILNCFSSKSDNLYKFQFDLDTIRRCEWNKQHEEKLKIFSFLVLIYLILLQWFFRCFSYCSLLVRFFLHNFWRFTLFFDISDFSSSSANVVNERVCAESQETNTVNTLKVFLSKNEFNDQNYSKSGGKQETILIRIVTVIILMHSQKRNTERLLYPSVVTAAKSCVKRKEVLGEFVERNTKLNHFL